MRGRRHAGLQNYVSHTDRNGYHTRVVSVPEPSTGQLIMRWNGTVDNGSCLESIIGSESVGFGLYFGPAKIGGKFASEARSAVLAEMAKKYASFESDTEFGRLSFTGNGTTATTADEQRLLAHWAQQVTMEAVGAHSITAVYSGDANWIGSTSPAMSYTV